MVCCDKPCYHRLGLRRQDSQLIETVRCCNCGRIAEEILTQERIHGPYVPD